jgi:hypothetical protein
MRQNFGGKLVTIMSRIWKVPSSDLDAEGEFLLLVAGFSDKFMDTLQTGPQEHHDILPRS